MLSWYIFLYLPFLPVKLSMATEPPDIESIQSKIEVGRSLSINAKLGSDGRLTLSGWFLNQLDSQSFSWSTKALLSTYGSIGGLFWGVKGYHASKSRAGDAVGKGWWITARPFERSTHPSGRHF
jgi:hypothetical protein